MEDKGIINSIVLNAELMMYGQVRLKIIDTQDGINVIWSAVTDGGDIITDSEKYFLHKNFNEIVDALYNINIEEDEDSSCCWSLEGFDGEMNRLRGIDLGYWDKERLVAIVNQLDAILSDAEILKYFYDLISYM